MSPVLLTIIPFEAGNVQNTALFPAVKSTKFPELEEVIGVRVSVLLLVVKTPVPTSHSL